MTTPPEAVELSEDDTAKLTALQSEYDELMERFDAETASEDDQRRFDELDQEIEAIEDKKEDYTNEAKGEGGAFVWLDQWCIH